MGIPQSQGPGFGTGSKSNRGGRGSYWFCLLFTLQHRNTTLRQPLVQAVWLGVTSTFPPVTQVVRRVDSEPLMNIIPPSRTPLVVHVTKLFPSHPAGKLPCVLSWNSMVHAIKVFSHPLQSSLVNENAPLISTQRTSRREPPHPHVTFSASSSSAHKQLRTVPKAKKKPKKDPELPTKDYDVRVAPLIVCDVFVTFGNI